MAMPMLEVTDPLERFLTILQAESLLLAATLFMS
jgi:hypothetical protein